MSETPITDLVANLLALGAAPEVVVTAVRAMELSRTNVPDKLREYERTRKKVYRAKAKILQGKPEANDAGLTPANVPQMSGTVPKPTNDSFLLSKPLKEGNRESKKEGAVVVEGRRRGTRLPVDWQPTPELEQFARDHNVDPVQLRPEFVDFWIGIPGQRGTKLDWAATWRNRVRQIQTYRKDKNGKDRSTVAASDRLNAKLAEFAQPDMLTGIRGPEGAFDVRLLPARRSG